MIIYDNIFRKEADGGVIGNLDMTVCKKKYEDMTDNILFSNYKQLCKFKNNKYMM